MIHDAPKGDGRASLLLRIPLFMRCFALAHSLRFLHHLEFGQGLQILRSRHCFLRLNKPVDREHAYDTSVEVFDAGAFEKIERCDDRAFGRHVLADGSGGAHALDRLRLHDRRIRLGEAFSATHSVHIAKR